MKHVSQAHGGSVSAKHVHDRSYMLSYGGAENPCESVEGTSTESES